MLSLHETQVACNARYLFRFSKDVKTRRFVTSPNPSQATHRYLVTEFSPIISLVTTHLYSFVKALACVKCLVQKHNTLDDPATARARNIAYESGALKIRPPHLVNRENYVFFLQRYCISYIFNLPLTLSLKWRLAPR